MLRCVPGPEAKTKFLEKAVKGAAYGTLLITQLRRLYRPLSISVVVEMSKRSFDTVFSTSGVRILLFRDRITGVYMAKSCLGAW